MTDNNKPKPDDRSDNAEKLQAMMRKMKDVVKVLNPTEQKLRMKSKAIVEGPVQFVQVLHLLNL
jgi:hypothetical protein